MFPGRGFHKVIVQPDRVYGSVGREDYLLGIKENGVVIVVKILREIGERAGEKTIKVDIGLAIFEAGEEHHPSIRRITP